MMKQHSGIGLFLLLAACSHTTFKYEATDPIHMGKADPAKAKVGDTVYGEKSAFAWTSCESVNQDAINDLLNKKSPDQQITELEWYDHRTKQYTNAPSCLTEKGWVWAVYTFWWPSATKVKVRGKIASPNPGVDKFISDNVTASTVAVSAPKVCAIEKKDDKFESRAVYESSPCVTEPLEGSYAFLRAFESKEGKPTTYQVYAIGRAGVWPKFYAAGFITDGKLQDIPVQEVANNVDCKTGFSYCSHWSHVIFDVSRGDLEAFAKDGLEFKLKGQGRSMVLKISKEHLETFLKAVK